MGVYKALVPVGQRITQDKEDICTYSDEVPMKIILCSDPFAPTRVDDSYADEAQAAREAGLPYELINFEALVHHGKPDSAVRRVKPALEPELALYRGWMLRPDEYQQLYAALQQRKLHLINSPDAYLHCHYLPESYPVIAAHTPATVSIPLGKCGDMDHVLQALRPFGNQPLILKDYVKSRKHEWDEACYIPSAADRMAVERVVTRFLELQGDYVSGGLVFREYVAFQPIGSHSQSTMPLTKEFRRFFLDGALLAAMEYWDEGTYTGEQPPDTLFSKVVAEVRSRFFTMDIAQRIDGDWMIVELGDAQVAGLPERTDVGDFYRRLAMQLPHCPFYPDDREE